MFDIILLKLSEMNHDKISSSILQSCFECFKKKKINKFNLIMAYLYLFSKTIVPYYFVTRSIYSKVKCVSLNIRTENQNLNNFNIASK